MDTNWSNSLAGNIPLRFFIRREAALGLLECGRRFIELEELGWVRPGRRPRMICGAIGGVCARRARIFGGEKVSQMWQNAETFASGLRVPKPYGDYIMLEILKESGGVALSFPDEQILASLKDWAKNEGIFLSPRALRPRLHMTTY